jgi:hypothetical protein
MKVDLITQRSNQNPTTEYNVIEEDPSSFFDAESSEHSSFDAEFSEAGGLRRFFKNRRAIQKQRQNRRDVQASSKAVARKQRTAAKMTQADSQKIAARQLGKTDPADLAMAEALKASSQSEPSKKSKTGLYIGIGAGVLLVAGIVTFLILRNKKARVNG